MKFSKEKGTYSCPKDKLLILGINGFTGQHLQQYITDNNLLEQYEIIGVDLEKYGPFKTEDIATIPYENAQALISKNIATKVRWED